MHCQAVADCQVAVAYANSLEREVSHLRSELARVLAVGDFGSANAPTLQQHERSRHVSSR